MVAPAWVKVRASDGHPADCAVSVALGKTWDGTTEVTSGITGMLTFNGSGYDVSGALLTFLRRSARTFVMQTIGGNVDGMLVSSDGEAFTFLCTSSNTDLDASLGGGIEDMFCALGSGSYSGTNVVFAALTTGASGTRTVGNNGTVSSSTRVSPGAGASGNARLMQSVFGDFVMAATLVDINCWNDSDRIADADLAALTVPAASGYTLTAAVGAFTLGGQAVALRAARKLVATKGTFTETGIATGLKRGLMIGVTKGTFVLGGQAVALKAARRLPVTAGAFVLTGKAVNLVYSGGHVSYTLPAGTGAFTLGGQAVSLRAARKLPVTKGTFALTGVAPAMVRGRYLPVTTGVFAISGKTAGMRRTYVMGAASAAYVLTGNNATLRYSNPQIWFPVAGNTETWNAVAPADDDWTPVTPASGVWS